MIALAESGRVYENEPILFSPVPSRLALHQLMVLPSRPGRQLKVNVWRNHSIEPLLPLCAPYFAFAGVEVDWWLSAYDDSLCFAGHQQAALELLWLDASSHFAKMSDHECVTWLRGRLFALRRASSAPIVVVCLAQQVDRTRMLAACVESVGDAYWADIGVRCESAGRPVVDQRSASIAGTPLNARMHALLARDLACHWIAGAMLPPIRAVVVDLDNTLYRGVLGEDGACGVELTVGHIALQESLRALRAQGVFLGLISRNEREDVDTLFAQRTDFPLHLQDFSALEVSWGDKAAALMRLAERLRIGGDAILFLDDNLGELVEIESRLPAVRTVHAMADAELTARALNYYPGLWRWRTTAADRQRIADFAANEIRQSVLDSCGEGIEYFRNLAVRVTLVYGDRRQVPRLAELCAKTNQFNMTLKRLTEANLQALMADVDVSVCSISLSDRLTESGIVGVLVSSRHGNRLVVEELCISCRALGRRMEDVMVLGALHHLPTLDKCADIAFPVVAASRNAPARDWLKQTIGLPVRPGSGVYVAPAKLVTDFCPPPGIILETLL